jgi:hypothetical protein
MPERKCRDGKRTVLIYDRSCVGIKPLELYLVFKIAAIEIHLILQDRSQFLWGMYDEGSSTAQ